MHTAHRHARIPTTTRSRALLRLWAAGLALCAVFPTNRVTGHSTLAGEIHRTGGALYLACLPLAALHLTRLIPDHPHWTQWLRRLTAASAVTAMAFGTSQVITGLPQGLLERLALIAQAALLAVLGWPASLRQIGDLVRTPAPPELLPPVIGPRTEVGERQIRS